MPPMEEITTDSQVLNNLPLHVDGDTDQVRRLRSAGRVLSVFSRDDPGENLYRGPHYAGQ